MKITSPLTKTVGSNTYAYTYDLNHPHAVKAISYNAEQMPIRIEQVKAGNTTIVDYLYDGMSTRIKKMVQGGATTFYIGEHFEVKDGIEAKYIFAGNLRVAKKTQQERYYFHKDHLGSSTAMTDATGAKVETTEYVPYGEMREHTGAEVTNYKFTDQELDPEIGLYNYGARLYDPVIGRFINPDTIIPNVYDPQTLNRYSYCRNNPLIYTDPTGHFHGKGKGHESITFDALRGYLSSEELGYVTKGCLSVDNVFSGKSSLPVIGKQEHHFDTDPGPGDSRDVAAEKELARALGYEARSMQYAKTDPEQSASYHEKAMFTFGEACHPKQDKPAHKEEETTSFLGIKFQGPNADEYTQEKAEPAINDTKEMFDRFKDCYKELYGQYKDEDSNEERYANDHSIPDSMLGGTENSADKDSGTGSDKGGTVLCTVLHQKRILSDNIYMADSRYAERLDPLVVAGYRLWARPLAQWMSDSKILNTVLTPFIKAWAYHMAYKMGVVEKNNLLGSVLEYIGVPVCRLIGKCIVKGNGESYLNVLNLLNKIR